jgi:hypothetical protein
MVWYEGVAQMLDNPWFNFILIQPLVSVWGSLMATKIYLIFFLFLFLLFSFLLFWKLSKNVFLSTVLSVAVARSWALYILLYSSGTGLSSCAQVAFPAALFFLLCYLDSGKRKSKKKDKKEGRNKKWLGLAILAASFGFYTHNLLAVLIIFPSLLLFLFFYSSEKSKSFFSSEKIKGLMAFGIGVLMVSLPSFLPSLIDFFEGGSYRRAALVALGKTAPLWPLFKSVNIAFFIFPVIAFLFSLFLGFGKKIRVLLPFLMLGLYFMAWQLSFFIGINPLVGVMFPHRFYWLAPLVLGGMLAVFLNWEYAKGWVVKLGVLFLSLMFLIVSLWFDLDGFEYETVSDYVPGLQKVLSGYWPEEYIFENLGAQTEDVIDKTKILPFPIEFIDTTDLNHRIWSYEPSVRIFWNMFYPMPQIHGYFHYRTGWSDNWFAWLFAVTAREGYEEDASIPAGVAERQSLFLADWYSIRFLSTMNDPAKDVGPHFYQDNPYIADKTGFAPPAGIELSREYVSQIARLTDEPVVGFVGRDEAYDYFVRNLGMLNLNSHFLIPIRAGEFIEDLTAEELAAFDGLVVYDYRKKGGSSGYQDAWRKLDHFIQEGGFVWVETGSECPEKWGERPAPAFPVSELEAGSLGKEWQTETDFYSDIDFDYLAPLTYEEGAWNVSFAPSMAAVRPGAEVLLSQKDKPVVVLSESGKGKIVWSGLNLFYRPLHHGDEALSEILLQEKIYDELISFDKGKLEFEFSRPSQERVVLKSSGARGALFKENNFGGWVAWARAEGKKIKLPVMAAGPDFMYAPLPKELWDKPVEVEFFYKGEWHFWLFFIVACFSLIVVLDMIILKSKIFGKVFFDFRKREGRFF